jgi:hypothetical protein
MAAIATITILFLAFGGLVLADALKQINRYESNHHHPTV